MGWCSRLAARLRPAAVLASLAGVVVLSLGLAPPAVAAPRSESGGPGVNPLGIAGEFGLAPVNQRTSYFQLAIAPGHAITAEFIIANLARLPQTLTLGHATGITAGNGGSAYLPAARRCSGPGCWVTDLPGRVTLAPKQSAYVTFQVRVPRGTRPGQYLTGIAAGSATESGPVQVGSNGHGSGALAVIHNTVTLGVAVTVGNLPDLVSRLSVHGVQGMTEGPVARLSISLYNTGQTFSHGTGQATCQAGGRPHTYPFYAATVLPGNHASIAVNAPGLPEGATLPCAVQLRYGHGQVVHWAGLVGIPRGPGWHSVAAGNGVYAEISPAGFPRWGIGLIIVCLLLGAAVVYLLAQQRRSRWR
jgi:hypothetical protein